jgi:GDP-L-fucose synthase
MMNYNEEGLINIGIGEDLSIKELAELMKEITGFKGKIAFDSSKPDGTPRKLMDVSKLSTLGWKASINLKDGITQLYKEKFLSTVNK